MAFNEEVWDAIDEAISDGIKKGRAEERANTVDILVTLFSDEPCNYNGMDEFADNEWCECHCGKEQHTVAECWKHAIDAGWIEKLKERKNDR